ncbi:cytochrome c [Ectothiorhodospiraceae bacterium 2226]|nr:cytochrome c [Ectothiorhodospiraceae bacterium 2226]
MRYIIPTAVTLLASFAAGAQDTDVQRGKALHDANCTACHGTSVYTRPDRRIQSLHSLEQQVYRCRDNLGFEWPERDVKDLVAYLNQTFYHFEE